MICQRTLVYGVLTANLVFIYFVSIVLLQQAFRIVTAQSSDFAVILSTLGASLFNPLRVRIQNAVDRRFYRNKYDAQKVLEQFAPTVRNEGELDHLAHDLINVVQETMQPTEVTLWLRKVR